MVKKGYKQTEIGVLPEDWGIKPAKDLMRIETGSRNTEHKVDYGQYPFFVRSQQVERIDTYHYNCEAVLTAGDGVGTGKVFHYINGKFDAHQRVYVMSNFGGILGKYFLYFFSKNFGAEVSKYTAKSSVDSVRRDMIAEMLIPVPSEDEQKDIYEAVSDVEQLIEILEKQLAKEKDIKQGTMQELLTGKRRLPGFSGEWETRTLHEISNEMVDGPFGSNLKTEHYTTERQVRIIQLSNIGEAGWNDANVKYTTFSHAAELQRCIVQPGSILIAKMMPAGRAIVCPDNEKSYILGSDVVKVVPNSSVDSRYLVYATKSRFYLDQIADDTQGSTRARTSVSKLRKTAILFPKKDEQIAIADILSEMDMEIAALEGKIAKYRQIKQGMMQQLLTGKIRLV